jgi:hypothetical protein
MALIEISEHLDLRLIKEIVAEEECEKVFAYRKRAMDQNGKIKDAPPFN